MNSPRSVLANPSREQWFEEIFTAMKRDEMNRTEIVEYQRTLLRMGLEPRPVS